MTRERGLDGLRGVAALAVCANHMVMATAGLSLVYLDPGRVPRFGADWWWGFSPLRVLWAGRDAVIVFFVLSGLVLSLPAAAGREARPAAFLTKRLVRLYVPIAAAVAVAVLWSHVGDRTDVTGASPWLTAFHTPRLTVGQVLDDLVVLKGTNFTYSALWSLKWEMLFSLAFPVVVVAMRRFRPPTGALVAISLVSVAIGATGDSALDRMARYLPLFVIGVAMAFDREWLADRAGRFAARCGSPGRAALIAIGVSWTGFVVAHLADGLSEPTGWWADASAAASAVIVATSSGLLVAAVWLLPSLGATFERRPLQWLGSRSFALYLVHEPMVVAYAYLVGGRPHLGALVAVVLPASLLAAELFHRAVERPSLRLAAAAGRMAPSGRIVGGHA